MNAEIEALFQENVSALARRRGYSALGRLAAWWMQDEVLLELGRSVHAAGDLRAGEFVVLLERRRPSPVIHEGIALPLRWIRTQSCDRRLPRALVKLVNTIAPERGGIELSLGEECPDLSQIDIGAESAAAMLAATLAAARVDAVLDATVTATATWGGSDLGPVDGLAAKVAAANRLRLKRIFVSRFQTELEGSDAHRIEKTEGKNRDEQVQQITLALDAPPMHGSLEARCEWYHRHARVASGRSRARAFFCKTLAPELATQHRAATHWALPKPDRLVVIATGRAENPIFAACVHQAREVLVLHEDSEQGRAYAASTQDGIDQCGLDSRIAFGPLAKPRDGFAEFLQSARSRCFEKDESSLRNTHVDVTGGTTLMKFALSEAACQLRLRRFVVDQRDRAEGGTIDVTTLRVIELPHEVGGSSAEVS